MPDEWAIFRWEPDRKPSTEWSANQEQNWAANHQQNWADARFDGAMADAIADVTQRYRDGELHELPDPCDFVDEFVKKYRGV